MIRFQNLALRRGAKLLVSDATVQIAPGEHVGLVGDNGSGKSSLVSLLLGELLPDAGDVFIPAHWRIAHVAQHAPHSERGATEFVIDGDRELRQLEADLEKAEAAHDGHAAGELHAKLADHDAYTARSRAESLLLGLGFKPAQLDNPVSSFSGGWKMRLALAQTLMSPSDLMLLDEPTNHLDLDAIVWLEEWLARYPGTLVIISHDRDFLDSAINVTLHLDGGTLKRYGGNYSTFEKERAIQLAVQQSAFIKQQAHIAHLESFIARFKAKASKARQAQSRVKALERMTLVAPAHASSPVQFEFYDAGQSPNPMIHMDHVACGYPAGGSDASLRPGPGTGRPTVILGSVSLTLIPGQRIGVLGANGQGKTTLVRTLAGELAPLGGELTLGRNLAIGYFAQHEIERLRPDDTPIGHITRLAREINSRAKEGELRAFLGRFDFGGDMAVSKIAPFSGGEKARLALAMIVFRRPNLLLLDEPTNHLDLEMRESLTMALAQFDGTLILVSHDRHLLRSTADEFILVADGKVEPFNGDLDDYRQWLEQRTRAAARQAAKAQPQAQGASVPAAPPEAAAAVPKAAAAKATAAKTHDGRSTGGQRKPIEREIAKLEQEIERLTTEKARLDALLGDPDLYLPPRQAELAAALARSGDIGKRLDLAEADWMARQETLARMAAL
ncbi:MAG: ATP-binding cassette domain-containing protein [Rhodocyclaceae bacterium]|jgi:ATP-binding cassette subfamily F protein 3|nr:ATP-binding cassette domain-containing protein [Rhodocyclaceae bacterium]MCA3073828.1 ATP-binding cassette domain-containing protein [Rhodocyclaceae bacterium]MCA3091811.1 ATP-binding cassette domain-containing protein [Rhodocyclaceae bacterium]MCA3093295.1 ATP-binding cassette domain-containing protein [Rhodocyclaceae bacterium]MCA3101441.1 ATP-binding cassette domain-containing protein [Rhodocyclaceae bacterium]